MSDTLRAAAQQALEALEEHGLPYLHHEHQYSKAITALRAALAELEAAAVAEPVAWTGAGGYISARTKAAMHPELTTIYSVPLYAAPPQREPLTDAADAARFRWLAEHTSATGLARWVHPFQFLHEAVDERMRAPASAPKEQA